MQWLHYDQKFGEWAAVKGLRNWVEMNLTIYGLLPAFSSKAPTIGRKIKPEVLICFRWNKALPFQSIHLHICQICGCPGAHTGK